MKIWKIRRRNSFESVECIQQKNKKRSSLKSFFSCSPQFSAEINPDPNDWKPQFSSTNRNQQELEVYSKLINDMGDSHLFSGEYELAKESYESALRSLNDNTTKSKNNVIQVARAFHGLGLIASILENFEPALVWLREAKNTILEQNSELTRSDMIELAAIFEDTGFVYYYGFENKMESYRFLSEALRIRESYFLNEIQDRSSSEHLAFSCDASRLKYMIEIAEELTKKPNLEYIKMLSDKKNNKISSLLGLKCPTVILMLCRSGLLRKTKYDNAKDAVRLFKEAERIAKLGKLSESSHHCVQDIQKYILELDDSNSKTLHMVPPLHSCNTRRHSL